MRARNQWFLGLAFTAAMGSCTAAVTSASTPPPAVRGPGVTQTLTPRPDQFEGCLINTWRGARSSQPFILSINRYASGSEVASLAGTLGSQGQYKLRDQLWKQSVGSLSVGGGIGRPVAAVLEQETPSGRKIRAVLNRPLSTFEVQNYTRSSKYPFMLVELTIDRNGHGEGTLIGAAKMRMEGNTLTFESLGSQPVRLLAVRED